MRRMTCLAFFTLLVGMPQFVSGQGIGSNQAGRAGGSLSGGRVGSQSQISSRQQFRPSQAQMGINARSRAVLRRPDMANRSQAGDAGSRFSNHPVFGVGVESRGSRGLGRPQALGLQIREEARSRSRVRGNSGLGLPFDRSRGGTKNRSEESAAGRDESGSQETSMEARGRARVGLDRGQEKTESRADFFLRNRLAQIEKMRDRAIEIGNENLLRKADDLERLARWQYELKTQQGARGQFASDPSKPQLQFRNSQEAGGELEGSESSRFELEKRADIEAGATTVPMEQEESP